MYLTLDRVAGECPHALLRVVLEREPEQRGEERVVGVTVFAQRCRELSLELEPDACLRVADPEAEEAAQELAERVVGDALRVRHALRTEESHPVAPAVPGLGGEAALADSGLAGDRDDRSPPVDQLGEDLVEHGDLLLAADERRDVALGAFPLARKAERLDGFGLPLQLKRAQRLELERVLDLPRGHRPDGDPSRARVHLKPSGDVDRVAECVVALFGGRLLRKEDDRTRVDPDAGRELDAVSVADVAGVRSERGVHSQRGPHGPFGVVLVRGRNAEERVEPVAGQLRDGAPEPLRLGSDETDDLVEEELRALGAELLADRRRVGDVGQEDGDDAPLAGGCGHYTIMSRPRTNPRNPRTTHETGVQRSPRRRARRGVSLTSRVAGESG